MTAEEIAKEEERLQKDLRKFTDRLRKVSKSTNPDQYHAIKSELHSTRRRILDLKQKLIAARGGTE